MVDAHLRKGGSGVASGRSGGLGGFLQHDAYLWFLVVVRVVRVARNR
jgi:hypothetical protein